MLGKQLEKKETSFFFQDFPSFWEAALIVKFHPAFVVSEVYSSLKTSRVESFETREAGLCASNEEWHRHFNPWKSKDNREKREGEGFKSTEGEKRGIGQRDEVKLKN